MSVMISMTGHENQREGHGDGNGGGIGAFGTVVGLLQASVSRW